jgi:hypothetical protein
MYEGPADGQTCAIEPAFGLGAGGAQGCSQLLKQGRNLIQQCTPLRWSTASGLLGSSGIALDLPVWDKRGKKSGKEY